MQTESTYTAFAGDKLIVTGDMKEAVLQTKRRLDAGEGETILIFEDETGNQVDFDFRGTAEEVVLRLSTHPLFDASTDRPRTGPGRPKLGVLSREVSLLPRHWAWLEKQPGGISVTLRRLVEEARKSISPEEQARAVRDATSKFMWAMAGNFAGFEEATRALFANDRRRFDELIADWPADIRAHIQHMLNRTT